MYHSLIKIADFELKYSLKDMKNITSPPEMGKDYHIKKKMWSFFIALNVIYFLKINEMTKSKFQTR